MKSMVNRIKVSHKINQAEKCSEQIGKKKGNTKIKKGTEKEKQRREGEHVSIHVHVLSENREQRK